MPLPAGYRPLLIADTRRAEQWERALRARGIAVVRVETRGEDAERGAWQIGVATADAAAAQRMVSEVTRRAMSLPAAPLPPNARRALVGVGLVMAVVLAAAAVRALAR